MIENTANEAAWPLEKITRHIYLLRGQKVLLDMDLASLYGVPTGRFNEQVKRNLSRFPNDFMFQLNETEFRHLKSQFAISKSQQAGRGGRRSLPNAFTEHGAIMAAAVLNSPRAIEVSVYVVRAFVQMRDMLTANKEFTLRLNELERLEQASREQIAQIIATLRELMKPPDPPNKRPIGFITPKD
jgi:hypothetical protein